MDEQREISTYVTCTAKIIEKICLQTSSTIFSWTFHCVATSHNTKRSHLESIQTSVPNWNDKVIKLPKKEEVKLTKYFLKFKQFEKEQRKVSQRCDTRCKKRRAHVRDHLDKVETADRQTNLCANRPDGITVNAAAS